MKEWVYRLRDVLLAMVILLFVGLVAVRLGEVQRQEMSGRPRVIDGDTLMIGGRRVRLAGIDAPELRQLCHRHGGDWTCGAQARDHLILLIGGSRTACVSDGSDRYGRLLAACSAAGADLNRAMVGSGYATAFGDYEADEDEARRKGVGLWAGTFDTPQTWRRQHGGMEEAPHIERSWPINALAVLGGRLWDILFGL